MKKIPFDIKFRPEIEAGKYKVVTEYGEPVRIICWDSKYHTDLPVIALVNDGDGEDMIHLSKDGKTVFDDEKPIKNNLILVSDEPEELTEFEKALDAIYESCGVKELRIKEKAADLLYMAREHFHREGLELVSEISLKRMLDDKYKEGYECCQEHDKERISKAHLEGFSEGVEHADKRNREAVAYHFPMYGSFVPPCYLGGPCVNPQHDCIRCPQQGANQGTFKTDTNIK